MKYSMMCTLFMILICGVVIIYIYIYILAIFKLSSGLSTCGSSDTKKNGKDSRVWFAKKNAIFACLPSFWKWLQDTRADPLFQNLKHGFAGGLSQTCVDSSVFHLQNMWHLGNFEGRNCKSCMSNTVRSRVCLGRFFFSDL